MSKLLLFDNYDSFTYNLKDYFEQLNQEVLVVRNDEMSLEALTDIAFDKLVISPGPKTPAEAGILMPLIDYYHDKKPVLGICLGHQALGQYFGCRLVKAEVPKHGKVSAISHSGDALYRNIPQTFNVCRYHSLLLEACENSPLRPTAFTAGGELMSFSHTTLPLTGIQYHPEAILTEYGLKVLENWLSLHDERNYSL